MTGYAYDGAAWREASTVWAYDGTAWRDVQEGWVYDGAAWRKWWEVSAGCTCTGATIDSFNQLDDVAACACGSGKFNTHYVTVRWTYSGATNPCHHIRVERSSNGSSWASYATDLDVDGTYNGCTLGAYEGCYKTGGCVTHLYYWRVKLELDSDDSVCDTSSSSQANNCIV